MAYLIFGHSAFATSIMNSQANPTLPLIGSGQEYYYSGFAFSSPRLVGLLGIMWN